MSARWFSDDVRRYIKSICGVMDMSDNREKSFPDPSSSVLGYQEMSFIGLVNLGHVYSNEWSV